MLAVAGHDAQEVVGVAEEPLGLQDLGDLSNGLFECSEGVEGVRAASRMVTDTSASKLKPNAAALRWAR